MGDVEITTIAASTMGPYAYVGYAETMYPNFYGVAASCNIFLSLVGIVVEIAFIIGAYPLMGWKSDFSFAILIVSAVCGLQRDIMNTVNCLLSWYEFLDPFEQILFRRILGNIYYVPNMTIIPLNISLSVHRFIYTLFPMEAQFYCNRTVCKIWIITMFSAHFGLIIGMTVTDLSSMMWYPTMLYVAIWPKSKYVYFLVYSGEYLNYVLGGFNLIAFPLLFVVLYVQGQLTFKKNQELRLTLHVTYVVVFEVYMAIQSYYQSFVARVPTGEDVLFSILTSGAYFFVIVLPYIILNRNIRKRVFCFEDSRSVAGSLVAVRSQKNSRDRNV